MKNTFRHKDTDFDNETHINRKKKADDMKHFSSKKSKNKQYQTLEYGLEDEDDLIEYEHYLK